MSSRLKVHSICLSDRDWEKLELVRKVEGIASISETVRRLIDEAYRRTYDQWRV